MPFRGASPTTWTWVPARLTEAASMKIGAATTRPIQTLPSACLRRRLLRLSIESSTVVVS
jgi:hypothetical protein